MKEYTYSVARVRAREASLLTRQDVDSLLSAVDYESALRLIRDRGYRSHDGADSEEIIAAARRELWDFVSELAGEDVLRVLRLSADYHNVKASVKAAFSGVDADGLLLEGGTVPGEFIYDCVKKREYADLDPRLAEVCEGAMALLLRTQDGQACDICIDNALLAELERTAKESGDGFIRRYADLQADTANLKAAYRCALAGRSLSFIENAVYDGGTLNARELELAAAQGVDALCDAVAPTPYGGCVEAMKQGAAALEKWCADELTRLMDEARWDSFSCAPILAYFHAKSTEIAAVRLILSGKRNQLAENMIRERVPRTYV